MATVPTAYTWTVGELVTASKVNQYLRDAVSFLLSPPHATMTHSVGQTTTTGADTALSFDTEESDSDNGHSTVTNNSRYTAQTAGYWQAIGVAPWTSSANGGRETFVRVNGATAYSSQVIAASLAIQHCVSITDKVFLNVADYVEICVRQTSGANLNVDKAFRGGQRFHMTWMGLL